MDSHSQEIQTLYEGSRLDVFRYLRSLGLDPHAAQDTTQEAFLRLVLEARKGQTIERPRSWVLRVAHNMAMDQLGSNGRMTDADVLQTMEHPGRSAEQALIERQRMDGYHAAVRQLSPQQRQCLELRTKGLKYREIAEVLGVEISTVAEFLRRAFRKLNEGFRNNGI